MAYKNSVENQESAWRVENIYILLNHNLQPEEKLAWWKRLEHEGSEQFQQQMYTCKSQECQDCLNSEHHLIDISLCFNKKFILKFFMLLRYHLDQWL